MNVNVSFSPNGDISSIYAARPLRAYNFFVHAATVFFIVSFRITESLCGGCTITCFDELKRGYCDEEGGKG